MQAAVDRIPVRASTIPTDFPPRLIGRCPDFHPRSSSCMPRPVAGRASATPTPMFRDLQAVMLAPPLACPLARLAAIGG